MPRKKLNVEQALIRFYKGDIDTIREAYPDLAYNGVVREVIHRFAENLRNGTREPIDYDPNALRIKETQNDQTT